ncbi:MAG: lytic transglycosylase domain-containing protein [Terracidiphilus sp.]
MKIRSHVRRAVLAGLAALVLPAAWGAERVTLTNGFALECDHHAQIDGRMRLYMSSGNANYMEFKATDVAGFEAVASPASGPARAAAPDGVGIRAGLRANERLTGSDVRQIARAAGRAHNLDVDLLASVIKAESGGNAHAVSRVGARGLMQLMPSTANTLGVTDSFEPNENVRGGSAYLDALLTRYHENLAVALAAYNAGPAAVDRYHGIPPYRETQVYVARVIHEFNRRVKARKAQLLPATGPEKPHSGE